MRKLLLSIVSILLILSANAQYVDDGQDAASVNWKQIDTEYFKLIYPQGADSLAQKYANVFYCLFSRKYSTLKHKPKKLPIILHTEGGRSNGNVMWAPKRMNLYASSLGQDDYVPFNEHLGIHEYRHVVQVDKMNQGLTKIGSYIFGEHAPIGVLGVYVPMWFMEGDAVSFETGNTKGGRGRIPSFEQKLRAQLVEKGIYSYDKAVFSSFNDFTPNKYVLGYYMIANARKHYGAEIWENTINSMARRPWNIYSFERGVRLGMEGKRDSVYKELSKELKHFDSRYVNLDSLMKANKSYDPKLTLYYDNMTELAAKWQQEDLKFKGSEYTVKSKENKLYASYKYPQYIGGDTIVAYKEDLNDVSSIVMIAGEEEKILFYPNGKISDLDYAKGTLAWSEYIPHVRWENAGRMVLSTYEMNEGKLKRYKYDENISDPAVFSNGEIMAIVENNLGRTSIVKFVQGEFRKVLSANDGESFQMPTWVDSNRIALVVLDDKGKHLEIVSIKTKERKIVSNSEYADIANPVYHNGKLYYSSSNSGKDVICSVDLLTGEKKKETRARFGNRYPSFKGDTLIYSNYTADGYQIVEGETVDEEYGVAAKYELAEVLKKQEKPELLNFKDTTRVFESKNYSRLGHLFKVHSWAPAFVNGFDRTVEGFADLGVSIASQNDLSTMFLVAGYKRDDRYDAGAAFAQMQYKGLWPIFDVKVDMGAVDITSTQKATLQDLNLDGKVVIGASRLETNVYGKMILPFNLSRKEYVTHINPYLKYEFYNISKRKFNYAKFYGVDGNVYNVLEQVRNSNQSNNVSRDFSVFSYNVLFYNLRKLSLRDINSRWGQVVEAGFIHSPFGDKDFGTSKYASVKIYTPGFFENHSLSGYLGYQHYSKSSFIRNIEEPIGMNLGEVGNKIMTTQVRYALPLMYPDYSLGGLIYTKRIYTNLFYDTVKIGDENTSMYFSAGADLRANIHVLRFKTPINIGVRYGYESLTKSPFIKLLFNVSFDI